MKVYYLIDEREMGGHISHHDALKHLQATGVIENYKTCSFIYEHERIGWMNTLEKAKTEIIGFQANIVVLSHSGKRVFPKSFFSQIKAALQNVVFVYDERDVHGFVAKRFPVATLNAAKYCDLVFLVAEGIYANVYRAWGCKDVRYLSHVTDDVRFGNALISAEKSSNVVMIGNLIKGRLFSMPGVKERYQLVKAFSDYYGNNFKVYGKGWENFTTWGGTIPYHKQEEVLASTHLSIGLDHFHHYHSYFSDRLPIALFSGIPHLSYNTPGVSKIFQADEYCFYFNDIKGAVIKSKKILEKNLSENGDFSNKVKTYVRENYIEKVRMQSLIKQAAEKLSKKCIF